jgi:hypothetical protein
MLLNSEGFDTGDAKVKFSGFTPLNDVGGTST